MKFFKDVRLDAYPTARIRRMIFEGPEGERTYARYRVELDDSGCCHIDTVEFSKLMQAGWSYVSAQAGTYLLERKEAGLHNDQFHRTPVIALAIDEEAALRPVTAEGVPEPSNWALLTPDGRVSDQYGGVFESEDAFLRYLDSDED